MPKTSSRDSVEFNELFSLHTHQVGATNGPYTSPDGTHLLISTPGSLALIDARIGGTQALVHTGSTIEITALVWISNAQGLIGCSNGTVYMIDFHAANLFRYSPVSISYAFKDIEEAVMILRYDCDKNFLAVGYQFGVSVWRNDDSLWNRVNHMRLGLPLDESLGIKTVEILNKPKPRVFLAGDFGHGLWDFFGSGPFCANAQAFGNSTLSKDGKYLALSSFNHSVCVWPIGAEGPRSSNSKPFDLTSGKEFAHLNPHIPVAMTQANVVASGSQEGDIFLTDTKNKVLSGFCAGSNLAVTGIQCHADRLYVSLAGPFGSVMVKCYSNKSNATREFEETRESIRNHHCSTKAPLPVTRIDLQEIRKITPANFVHHTRKAPPAPPGHKHAKMIMVRRKGGTVRKVDRTEYATPSVLEGCLWALKVFVGGSMLGLFAFYITNLSSSAHGGDTAVLWIKEYIYTKYLTWF